MIHSATIKKAEKMGVSLSEDADTGKVDAHWVEHNVHAYGMNAKAAMAEMEAIQKIKAMSVDYRIVNSPHDPFHILVFNHDRSLVLDRDGATPIDTLMMLERAIEEDTPWKTTTVPEDGGEAHKQGFHITDNPWADALDDEEHEYHAAAITWDEDWEASADEEESEDEEPGGSVVKQEYRIRYAEKGHPNHCGDWLANVLNDLVLGKSKTDVDLFEAICNANDVDMSKYNRTSPGWQGRFRMTGRNLVARKIYLNGGIMLLPKGAHPDGITELRAPDEWMAAQKFRMPKAELAQAEKQAKEEA